MFNHLLFVLCVFGSFHVNCNSVKITKCRLDDSKCIKDSANSFISYFVNGIQEFGVGKTDPLFLKYVDSSSPSLKLVLNDLTVTGLKDCFIRKIVHNVTKSSIVVKLTCSGHMEGQYEMKGRLLILPIEGKGKVIVTLRKTKINVLLDMNDITGNDIEHWDIKNWTHTYELTEKSDLVFENLFNGNELLGRAARELISSNSNDIIIEIGSPVLKAVVKTIVDNVNNMFHAIPAADLKLN